MKIIIVDIYVLIKNTFWFCSTIQCNRIELGEKLIRNIHPRIN